jgi:hypothetical protein
MNGKGNVVDLMSRAAQQTQAMIQGFLLRYGISAIAFEQLGGHVVKCTCMRPECSGAAIQFEGRAHFLQNGMEVIPRPEVKLVHPDANAAPEEPKA